MNEYLDFHIYITVSLSFSDVSLTAEPMLILLSKQSVHTHENVDLSPRVAFLDMSYECQATSPETLSPPQSFQHHDQYPHPNIKKHVHFTELLRT